MSTQSAPPRNIANELAKGGIVSRRGVLKGALVGAGALAAMSLPTPLLDLVPGAKPKEAMAVTQNVADGIYAIRYKANTAWALDVLGGNPGKVDALLSKSNWTPAQLWIVVYDEAAESYKVIPMVGYTAGMVLTATAEKYQAVKMRKDTKANNQRWVFKQNPNGSWSICNKGNTSLCVNLLNDNRSEGATIDLYTYSSSDTADQWALDLLVPAVETNLHYLDDVNQLYSSDFTLSNVRENHPEVLSMPSSGWTMSKDSGGYPDKFTHDGIITKDQAFSFVYRDVADLKERAIDVRVDVNVLVPTSCTFSGTTFVDLSWSSLKGLFGGINVGLSNKWTTTYTVYDHETGEQISLKGAYLTMSSLNGPSYGEPGNFYGWTGVYDSAHEGAAYLQKAEGAVDAYIMKNNTLCNFCEGTYFGNGLIPNDELGGADSEKAAVMVLCKDDSPTIQYFGSIFYYEEYLSQWTYPLFAPLGILNPSSPSKSVEITE